MIPDIEGLKWVQSKKPSVVSDMRVAKISPRSYMRVAEGFDAVHCFSQYLETMGREARYKLGGGVNDETKKPKSTLLARNTRGLRKTKQTKPRPAASPHPSKKKQEKLK